jgi:spermidine synthase
LQVLLALLSVAVIHLPAAALQWLGGGIASYALILLFPAIVSGVSLPLAVRMVVAEPGAASVATGRLFAANTGGGILGSVLVGFIVLPMFGLTGSMWLTSGASMAAGICALLLLGPPPAPRLRWLWMSAGLACWLLIPRVLDTQVPADFLAQRGSLVDFREGVSANLAVVRQRGVLQLEIDRWWQGSARKSHQVLAAHLPMLLHPAPESVLVVGAGTGQTASRFLMYDIQQLYCVDIEPQIFEFIGPHFGAGWMQDARTQLIRDDARNYIALTQRQFDVISLEVGQVFRPGAASFYTADFYHAARQRLARDGLLAQFLPLPFFTPQEFRMVLRSFLTVFPESVLWYNTSELLLIGVNADRFRIDPGRFELATPGHQAGDDLDFSHWGGAEHHLNQTDVLLAGFLAGPDALSKLAGNAPLYRDDRPVLEYTTSYFTEQRATEIAIASDLSVYLEQVDAVLGVPMSDDRRQSIAAIRELNLADIVASARIRQADVQRRMGAQEEAARLLGEALQGNPHSATALRMSGEMLTESGKLEDALRLFRRAEALQPGDLHVRRGLGYLLHHQGSLKEAMKYYRLVLAQWREDAGTHNNLGAALAASGDPDAARGHFERALQLRPDYADAIGNLQRLGKP